jgi:hypothetical protein
MPAQPHAPAMHAVPSGDVMQLTHDVPHDCGSMFDWHAPPKQQKPEPHAPSPVPPHAAEQAPPTQVGIPPLHSAHVPPVMPQVRFPSPTRQTVPSQHPWHVRPPWHEVVQTPPPITSQA